MIKTTWRITIPLSTILFGWAFGFSVLGIPLTVALVLGGLSFLCCERKVEWGISGILLFHVSLAGTGVFMAKDPTLLLFALTFSIATWDLENFERRWLTFATDDQKRSIEIEHLKHLFLLLASAVLLATIVLHIQSSVSFGVVSTLAILLGASLSGALLFVRNKEEDDRRAFHDPLED